MTNLEGLPSPSPFVREGTYVNPLGSSLVPMSTKGGSMSTSRALTNPYGHPLTLFSSTTGREIIQISRVSSKPYEHAGMDQKKDKINIDK